MQGLRCGEGAPMPRCGVGFGHPIWVEVQRCDDFPKQGYGESPGRHLTECVAQRTQTASDYRAWCLTPISGIPLRSAPRAAASIQRRASVSSPRPVQRRHDSLDPSGLALQVSRYRSTSGQLLGGPTFRFDQLVGGDVDTFRHRRRCEAPGANLRFHDCVGQPATGLHHAGAIPVWYTTPDLLVVEPFRGLPQRRKLSSRHPHVARGNLCDVGRRYVHVVDVHMLGSPYQVQHGKFFTVVTLRSGYRPGYPDSE